MTEREVSVIVVLIPCVPKKMGDKEPIPNDTDGQRLDLESRTHNIQADGNLMPAMIFLQSRFISVWDQDMGSGNREDYGLGVSGKETCSNNYKERGI